MQEISKNAIHPLTNLGTSNRSCGNGSTYPTQDLGPVKLNLVDNPQLQGLTLADVYPSNSAQVDVFIGADHHYSFVTGICKRGENLESLVAVESHFGWILTGPIDSYSKHTTAMLMMVENNEVSASLRWFWELESIRITETVNPTMPQEDELAVIDFKDGLNLQANLASVLIRFRIHRVGLIADVEKMYLQITLAPKDQDVHRYLWRDLKTEEAPKIYRILRLTFGVTLPLQQ